MITYKNVANDKIVTEPGLSTQPGSAQFNEYELRFHLQPYPQVGKEINKSDYRLLLTVNKRPALSGGILVTFDVLGETYRVFITNKQAIVDALAVQNGQSKARIPNGRVLRGKAPYNEPWSWHIDSEDIQMAEVSAEVSDGTPSQVEKDLDYWVDTVKRFSPWNAKIVSIEDYR